MLKKTFKGVLHEVKLLYGNGCMYEGKEYKSLSGVAKAIAGCNHNGLLFFGLIKRESKTEGAASSASCALPARAFNRSLTSGVAFPTCSSVGAASICCSK